MDKEIWKDIEGYDGFYQVSSNGRIRSWKGHPMQKGKSKKPKVLKPATYNGYKYVRLPDKMKIIHRIVGKYFVPNPDNKPEINHIDGNKGNNNYKNLEWATRKDNMRHAYENGLMDNNSGLTENDVLDIRNAYKLGCFTYKEIASAYGMTYQNVEAIINRKSWRHI